MVVRRIRASLVRLRRSLGGRDLEQDLRDELDAHIALHAADNMRAGMPHGEARRRALVALGGIEATKERYRDRRGLPILEMVLKDGRFAGRMLRKRPAFTLVTLCALTIGMGANAVIFSVVNALILRPLPVRDPGELVRAYTNGYSNTSYAAYLDYRDRNRTLAGLSAFGSVPMTVRIDGFAEHVVGTAVSGNYFEVLGVPAAHGRAIRPEDDRRGAAGVVMLSHAFWQRRFAGDPATPGRSITINGQPFTVIGVAPPSFTGTQAPVVSEVWVAWNAPTVAPTPEELLRERGRSAHLIGRLSPGVTLSQAQADLATIPAGPTATGAANRRSVSLTLFPADTLLPQLAGQVATFLSVLGVIAALMLIIACVNIAGLLLARAGSRKREMAVRLALGASRRRLVGQLLTESLLLSALAAVASSALVVIAGRWIAQISLPVAEPLALDLTVDWRVLAFTAGLCIGTTMLFGLVPALQASGIQVLAGLKEGVTTTPGRGRTRLRAVLMTTQVALSTVLLIAAGVLVRSITSARSMDIGFSPAQVLAANLDLSTLPYSRARGLALYADALTRLEQDLRVDSATMIGVMPLTVSGQALGLVKEGAPAVPPGRRVPPVFYDSVARRYFQTLGIPLLLGRDFASSDDAQAPAVAIVNETLANRFWPGASPLGQRLFSLGPGNVPGAPIEVVGVARNAKYTTVGEDPKMFMYRPLSQEYSQRVTLLVKTTADPMALLPVVRGMMQELDPDVALFRAGALDRATRISLLPLQVAGSLAGALGVIALALAAIGIYGMTSYLVRQRTREIGVRLALGADPARLVRTLTREGMLWTAAGLGLGWTAALASTQLLRSFLYGVGPTDPVAFLAVPLVLGATAYAACRIPASAVIHVDPLTTLRDE